MVSFVAWIDKITNLKVAPDTDKGLYNDEHGNCYVSSTSRGGSRGSGRKSSVYNCCSGVPTFGYDRKHTCRNCGEYHYIGNHKCIRE